MKQESKDVTKRTAPAFQQLLVWQRAIDLSVAIYKLTAAFPSAEQFGMTAQLRRAGVSVASNISEGYGRSTREEYVLFLGHARESNCEVQTQLVIASRLGFGKQAEREQCENLADEVGRMLVAMINKLRNGRA